MIGGFKGEGVVSFPVDYDPQASSNKMVKIAEDDVQIALNEILVDIKNELPDVSDFRLDGELLRLKSVPEDSELFSPGDEDVVDSDEQEIDEIGSFDSGHVTVSCNVAESLKKHETDIAVLRSVVGECFARLQTAEVALKDWNLRREELVQVVEEQMSHVSASVSQRVLDMTTAVERSASVIRSELRREVTRISDDMQTERLQREMASVHSRALEVKCTDLVQHLESLDRKLDGLDGDNLSSTHTIQNVKVPEVLERDAIARRASMLRRQLEEESSRRAAESASLTNLLDTVERQIQLQLGGTGGAQNHGDWHDQERMPDLVRSPSEVMFTSADDTKDSTFSTKPRDSTTGDRKSVV